MALFNTRSALTVLSILILVACAQKTASSPPAPSKAASACLRLADDEEEEEDEDHDDHDHEKDDTTTSDSSDCDDPTPTTTDTAPTTTSIGGLTDKDYAELESPQALKECHAKKLMYDRKAEACHAASLDMSWCTSVASVKTAFGTSGAAVETALNTHMANGYKFDQCGKAGAIAYVMLIKRDIDSNKLPKIDFKTLQQAP